MNRLRQSFDLYNQRFTRWINNSRYPDRQAHVMQAMFAFNMCGCIVYLTQIQRWRLGAFDQPIVNVKESDPELWAMYEQEVRDSIIISEMREKELAERKRIELETNIAAPSEPNRFVKEYNIDGRIRKITYVKNQPHHYPTHSLPEGAARSGFIDARYIDAMNASKLQQQQLQSAAPAQPTQS